MVLTISSFFYLFVKIGIISTMKVEFEINLKTMLFTIVKYAVIFIIIGGISIFCAKKFTNYFDTPIINCKSEITEKEVISNTSFSTSNQSTRAVTKEISKIQENPNNSNLVVSLDSTAKNSEIQKEVNKTDGDVAISEPTNTHTGTNIYSIKINKTKHALGVYIGSSFENVNKDKVAFGVHYRNRRIAYQLGRTFGGDFEGRVIWEAIQW